MSILEGFKTITKTLRAASATIRDEIRATRDPTRRPTPGSTASTCAS